MSEKLNVFIEKTKTDEQIASIIAKTILCAGIIVSVVLVMAGIDNMPGKGKYHGDKALAFSLIGYSLSILFTSIITWAVLKVLCNISNNIKEINSKMR